MFIVASFCLMAKHTDKTTKLLEKVHLN